MLKRQMIQVHTTELQVIKLTDEQRNQIAIETLLEAGGLHDEHFIEDGKLKEWIEHRHGSPSRETVRESNATDNLIFEAIKLIRDEAKHKAAVRDYKSPAILQAEIKALQEQLVRTEQESQEKAA